MAAGLTCIQDIFEGHFLINMVHTVGIVPEYPEIRGSRLHRRQAVHHPVAVAYPLRIGMKGNAPDSLDGSILPYHGFHHLHVRSVLQKRDRNHLDSQLLANLEMPVVPRDRTKEFHRTALICIEAPWLFSLCSEKTVERHGVKHQIQAGITPYYNLVRLQAQKLAQQTPAFRNPF